MLASSRSWRAGGPDSRLCLAVFGDGASEVIKVKQGPKRFHVVKTAKWLGSRAAIGWLPWGQMRSLGGAPVATGAAEGSPLAPAGSPADAAGQGSCAAT